VPFVVWVSTAREVNSRRPQEKTLRTIEYAPAGTTFTGDIRLPAGKDAEADLLVTAVEAAAVAGGGGRVAGGGKSACPI